MYILTSNEVASGGLYVLTYIQLYELMHCCRYGMLRAGGAVCNELRNIIFSKVAQVRSTEDGMSCLTLLPLTACTRVQALAMFSCDCIFGALL